MNGLISKLINFFNKKYCIITLALCIVLTSLITIAEIVMKMIKFDFSKIEIFNNVGMDDIMKNARLLLIYLAANALVGLLIELRSRLKTVEKTTHKSFTNMIEATNNIKDVIIKAASRYRTNELVIRVYGRRNRHSMDIIKSALDEIRRKHLNNRKIKIFLYYSNSDFLESLKSFNGTHSFINMIDDQIKATNESKDSSIREIDPKRYNFVELNNIEHFDTPPFWAIQIDEIDIFWGYFMLTINNDDSQYYQGTPNKCFHFNATFELDGFSDWINNIFRRLDKWNKDTKKT